NAQTGGRPWLALSQYELARVLLSRRRSGDRKRARELLRAALGIARDTGMRALQSRIERIGRDQRRLGAAPLDGLTPREREVLRLLASAKSTRDITDELGLSARTTSRHITNICAKIAARNRVEATNHALSHGL